MPKRILDWLAWIPVVDNFLHFWGLKTGAVTSSIIGIFHPAWVTMYVNRDSSEEIVAQIGGILSGSLFAASAMLFIGIIQESATVCVIYECYILVFLFLCFCMIAWTAVRMYKMGDFNVSTIPCATMPLIFFSILGYFMVVVNSYRLSLG